MSIHKVLLTALFILSFLTTINPLLVQSQNLRNLKSHIFANQSVLASGRWVKFKISEDGIYKISSTELQSLGFSNVQNVKIFGNKPGMLSLQVAGINSDDLIEIASLKQGNDIIFFAHGPHTWSYDPFEQLFVHRFHNYSDFQHFFLSENQDPAKEILSKPSLSGSPDISYSTYLNLGFFEPNDTNLIKSGRVWYGDEFNVLTNRDYSFHVPNADVNQSFRTKIRVAAHSTINSSFTLTQNGNTISIPAILLGPETTFAYENQLITDIPINSDNIVVSLQYNKTSSVSKAWLDYVLINAPSRIEFQNKPLLLRNKPELNSGQIIRYSIQNWNSTLLIWDISDFSTPVRINPVVSGNTAFFQYLNDIERMFVVFDPLQAVNVSVTDQIPNQNIHGTEVPDMLIVTKELYLPYAQELADLHYEKDQLQVAVFTDESIYNEFSSGNPDISAIRNMVKMFYDRGLASGNELKYLLFYGDVSYNNKMNFAERDNYLLSYQNLNSIHPISSVYTDDFFGFLDDDEGDFLGKLDVGIGRLPVSNERQAELALNKIKSYYNSFGNWRMNIALIADDPDGSTGNQHMNQAESIAVILQNQQAEFNLQKIYLDAFPQQVTASGERYPDASVSINNRINKGSLFVNYTGHGNEIGLSHERVITTDFIQSWRNNEKMPFFVTATCEFSRMDDHNRTSGGEYVFLNENGGGIGLFTTTRSVYYNSTLNTKIYEHAFDRSNGDYPRLGDIVKRAKNESAAAADTNIKKYTLIGDPALRLAYPKLKVFADSINGQSITTMSDTLGALSFVTIKGYIADQNEQFLNEFEGTLYPTIFDKKQTEYTLGNEGGDIFPYQSQTNILYQGKASIQEGRFSFSFIIPKDISYLADYGKISLYAANEELDGSGAAYFMVGGSSDQYEVDYAGPEIRLFMNDTNFIDGGITDQNPVLLANLFDESGINTVGVGIGHDISAVLDEDIQTGIVLNDYYESDLDSYQRGRIRYPFHNLEDGEHTIRVKVWDIHNNSSSGSLRFIVASSAEMVIKSLRNFPNPFIDYTSFFIEHNQADQNLAVQLEIVDMQGRRVKHFEGTFYSSDYTIGPIEWDGTGSSGTKLHDGIYIYRVILQNSNGEQVHRSERLVMLR